MHPCLAALLCIPHVIGASAQAIEIEKLKTGDSRFYRVMDSRKPANGPALELNVLVGRHSESKQVFLYRRYVPSDAGHKPFATLADDSCLVDLVAGEWLIRHRPCPLTLQSGETWRATAIIDGKPVPVTYRYEGPEDVTTPMGPLRAYKITAQSDAPAASSKAASQASGAASVVTWWYSTVLRAMVQVRRHGTDPQTGQAFEVSELLTEARTPVKP